MEKTYLLSHAEIVAAFQRWHEAVVANPADFNGDPADHEASAACFLKYAGLGDVDGLHSGGMAG